jgi:outer membrane protein assembly factor BamB
MLMGVTLLAALGCLLPADAQDWTRFRGPNGSGISDLEGVPTQWTEEDYEWTTDLPGIGHSSPIILGERLFITTGLEDGTRQIHCLNATTGVELWMQAVKLTPNALHAKNSYGSSTPVVDDERVYVAFTDTEHYLIHAYSLDGELIWSEDLGTFVGQHGHGVSLVRHGQLLIVPNDQEGPSSIIALNAATSEEVWRNERASREISFSAPFVLEREGEKPQLICLSGITGLTGIDLESGETIWTSGELPLRTVANPFTAQGMVFATCGQGGRGMHLVAVDPGGSGDVSTTHIRYVRERTLPYVPTPIEYEGLLYFWCDDGVVCCVDPATGEDVWMERVGGAYSGSPILIDGRIYCVSEEGEVAVIDASPTYHFYGFSPLGDLSYSTPSVGNGRLYIKGWHRLACLKAESPSGEPVASE